jgi:hypothetical protein
MQRQSTGSWRWPLRSRGRTAAVRTNAGAGARLAHLPRLESIMNTSSVLFTVAAAAAFAACCNAGAQALPAALGAQAVLPEIRIAASMPLYPIRMREARAVRGVYAMSNGWTMEVRPDWKKVYADIDRRGEVELLPLSADRFVSADGRMAMEFNVGAQGDEVVLRYIPNAATAQVVEVRSTLASR